MKSEGVSPNVGTPTRNHFSPPPYLASSLNPAADGVLIKSSHIPLRLPRSSLPPHSVARTSLRFCVGAAAPPPLLLYATAPSAPIMRALNAGVVGLSEQRGGWRRQETRL